MGVLGWLGFSMGFDGFRWAAPILRGMKERASRVPLLGLGGYDALHLPAGLNGARCAPYDAHPRYPLEPEALFRERGAITAGLPTLPALRAWALVPGFLFSEREQWRSTVL